MRAQMGPTRRHVLGRLAAIATMPLALRFFGGMPVSAIAEQLHLDESTVRRIWSSTREWLKNRLSDPIAAPA